jgi:porin
MSKQRREAIVLDLRLKYRAVMASVALCLVFAMVAPWACAADDPAISSNPAAVNIVAGTGRLGRLLGLRDYWGVRLGGVWVGDSNYLISGGNNPGQGSFNSLLILDLNVDLEKALKIPGAQFGIEYLRFNGHPTNDQAGLVTGYNSLPGAPPLDRTELYQLYWRERLFSDKLIFRIGKSVPTYDFNNVIRPVPVNDRSLAIPAVTGLLFTPLFVNTTLLGAIPGYYNSAYGLTLNFAPVKEFYASYGIYDGNVARGQQTGLQFTPQFKGYYFNIGEVGTAWLLSHNSMPGTLALGGWHQSGKLTTSPGQPAITENGTEGLYTFATQRLWLRNPGVDSSGVSSFVQFGINTSDTLPANKYLGGGFTGFGLVPKRPNDSAGAGVASSWLNQNPEVPPNKRPRSTEVILQAYYQMEIVNGIYFEPAVSYVPHPGQAPNIAAATAITGQITLLF